LALFLELVRHGPGGASIGTLQERSGVPATTLSHHLAKLTAAGLVSQERQARTVVCRANLGLLHDVLGYLYQRTGLATPPGEAGELSVERLHTLVRTAIAPKRPVPISGGGTMYPQSFEYLAPTSLAEAIRLLKQHGDDAKILSGGHSLVPLMKLRLATPAVLVDINGIPGLDYLREEGGYLKIGALTRESTLEEADLIRRRYPLLYETTRLIADAQVRNRATVGGNLAHGDPANDHPAAMLALGAELTLEGAAGERVLPVRDFFVDTLTTALQPDEILKEIRVPMPPARSGGAYLKLERRVGDFAIVAVAAQVSLDAKGVCSYAGIGLTNVAPTPVKATAAEAALQGKPLTEKTIAEAARLAADAADPSSDTRAPADYKRAMVAELTRRALQRAAEHARGGN
jgi:carbon-monoxide dehydrogenase medium subunit